jgi:hypothetical protein
MLVCWHGAGSEIEGLHGHTIAQRLTASSTKKASNINGLATGRGRGLTP